MSRLTRLLELFGARTSEKQARRIEKLAELNRALHREVSDLRDAVARVAELTASVQLRTEQLMILRREDATAGARLARLEPAFDAGHIASHVHAAVERAELEAQPFPHLAVLDLFPRNLFDALGDAIPPRIFFDDRRGQNRRISLPPRLAPVASIVAWEFLVAQVVNPVLVPAIVERFQLPATHPAPESHLVLCREGFPEPHTPTEERDVLTAIVLLARPGDGEDVGFGLFEPDAGENRYRLVKSVPLRPNSALVCLQGPGARASLSPPDGGAARELYVLEVRVTTT